MSRLELEMQHMLRLLSTPTSFRLWKAYLWDKAKRLAESDPAEFSGLPQALTDEMKKAESNPSPSKPRELGTPS
jgi:hypothetical protein